MRNPHGNSIEQRKKTDKLIEVASLMKASKIIFDNHHMVHRTQLVLSNQLSETYHAKIFLKREDEQKGKTFKIRGSYYKYLSHLSDPRLQNGLVCASDGNFAQSLSMIAGYFKGSGFVMVVKCVVFIPAVCNKSKLENMRRFGMEYIEFRMIEECFEFAVELARKFAEEHKMIFMHPFDDIEVITGYSSLAAEIIEDSQTPIDYVIVPSGGGGLLAGMSSFFRQISPKTQIVCVQPQNANPMFLSLQQGKLTTVNASRYCDGSSVKQIGQIPFEICKNSTDLFVNVTEGKISQAIIDLYTKGIISEPSGAMSVAALDQIKDKIKGKTVVCIVTGANTDLSRLEEAKEKSMIFKGYKNYYLINLPNQHGILNKLIQKCIHEDDIISSIQYKRKLNKEESQVLIGIESKNQAGVDHTVRTLGEMNIRFENINLKSDILDLLF